MTFTQFVVLIGIIVVLICIPIQRRALNKIAFGRSMFITFAAILMGIFIAVVGSGEHSIVSILVGWILVLLGYLMLVYMAVKSFQRLRRKARKQ
jgi:uncharacterized membrane protein